jgi:hypothetical protein
LTAVRIFCSAVEDFVRYILRCHDGPLDGLQIGQIFWRYETQKRGAMHAHLLIWIKDAPPIQGDGSTHPEIQQVCKLNT